MVFGLMFYRQGKCQLENPHPRVDSNAYKYGTKEWRLSRTGTQLEDILRDIFIGRKKLRYKSNA